MADVAYALYVFNLTGFADTPTLRVVSSDPDLPTNSPLQGWWLGLGNIAQNRWDWYQQQPAKVTGITPATLADYISPDGLTYVVLLCVGQLARSAHVLTFRPYDEIEDNDAEDSSASTIGGLHVTGLLGSIGMSGSDPGYDGDNSDYWLLASDNSGFTDARVSVVFNHATAGLSLQLVDSNAFAFAQVDSSSLPPGDNTLELQVDQLTSLVAPGAFPVYVLITTAGFSGYSDYSLSASLGAAPTAVLAAAPDSGSPPLLVSLLAGGSSDSDGQIVAYRFDPDNGSSPVTGTADQLDVDYLSTRAYAPQLTVYDNDGLQAEAHTGFIVGASPYTEGEPNDTADAANALSGSSGTIKGSIGRDPDKVYHGYDGGYTDFFSLPVNAPESLLVKIVSYPAGADKLSLYLFDHSFGDVIIGSNGVLHDRAQAPPLGSSIVDLRVMNTAGNYGDYTLDYLVGMAPTVDLSADHTSGSSPLTVTFTATASDSDGTVVEYAFDLNGDGTDDQVGASDSAIHMYTSTQTAIVRVKDNQGSPDQTSCRSSSPMRTQAAGAWGRAG